MSSRASRSRASGGSCSWICGRDAGVARREVGDDRQQRAPDGGRERRDPHGAGRLRRRVEVEPGGLDRGEDRHGVVGQPAAGRGQPDPPAVGLDERRCPPPGPAPRCCCETRRGGRAELVGDLAHRAEPGELEQQLAAGVGPSGHCSRSSNGMSSNLTWTRTVPRPSTGAMTTSSRRPRRRLDGDRLDALRPARPRRLRRAVRPGRPEGAAWLRLVWAGVHRAGRSCARGRSDFSPARRCVAGVALGVVTAGVTMLFMAAVGPAAPRHRQRPGVPRPARGRRGPQPRASAAALAARWPRSACCC